jgi:hypothetical protein
VVSNDDDNPELAAAEALVNRLPDPPPSANPFFDIVLGNRPRWVSFPSSDEPTSEPDEES